MTMSVLVKSLKRSLTSICHSLRDFGVIVEEHAHGNGKYGVDYVRGQNKASRVVAHYESEGLKILDAKAPTSLINAHATTFRALMDSLVSINVEARPMTEEEEKVQKLKRQLLNS